MANIDTEPECDEWWTGDQYILAIQRDDIDAGRTRAWALTQPSDKQAPYLIEYSSVGLIE